MLNLDLKIYLIRHGQSEINILPDQIGQKPDSKLTSLGLKQAACLYDYYNQIPFDYVYSSTYDRAYDTARIATFKDRNYKVCPIVMAPQLREYDAGDWTGASRREIVNDSIKLDMGNFNNGFLPPNGESLNQVERRSSEWLENNILYNENLEKFCSQNGSARIAIFTHGMTIKCLLHYVMGFDKSFTYKISIDNTSVTALFYNKGGWFLHNLNDTSHIR